MRSSKAVFHIVFVAWPEFLVDKLAPKIVATNGDRCTHILHPRHTAREFFSMDVESNVRFLRSNLFERMPEPDGDLLTSLESDGVPTIHNMILGDRIVAKLPYRDALAYATFLARRFAELYRELEPSVIVGSFDALHSGLALAVARRMGIPWYAPNFSVIPTGLACFCDGMSPAARVQLTSQESSSLRSLAETALVRFERKDVDVPAYITPSAPSLSRTLARLPARLGAVIRTLRRARVRASVRFTEDRTDYHVGAAIRHLCRVSAARKAIARVETVAKPPTSPYVFFGLHMQPESSIDVWAPFFSDQGWVIDLIARSLPPTHRLLVKIHKSDAANYSRKQLERMRSVPGVELVEPFSDSRQFIERADLLVAIQGTMGLEAALLGKPVLVLGDSPVALFPSASRLGTLDDLPSLVRRKLAESSPVRDEIIDAYMTYLAPFLPASHNDWSVTKNDAEIDNFVLLFRRLRDYVVSGFEMDLRSAL